MAKKSNVPSYMVTYADLMSLLLCFFVLLLSFSQVDAQKFRTIAGELSKAFGVQREIEAQQIPKGTSAALDQFSPAVPDRTLLDEIRQRTMEEQPNLESMRQILEAKRRQQTLEVAQEIRTLLEDTGNSEVTSVEVDGFRVVIRIQERGSFMSGSDTVTPSFAELLADMSEIFVGLPGTVAIEGHTDNVPINTARFESNWDLSAMRAASVANLLLQNEQLAPDRLLVQGFADTEPRATNETAEGRAQNRRVEINIDLSEATEERGERSMDELAADAPPEPLLDVSPPEDSADMLEELTTEEASQERVEESIEETVERFNPFFPND
ncbi:flagellar motor protein MotB [Vreelandella massiliensis]|uniref:flagellar motor protein MotB n=1 Tax=Vreelandella massiliensis TaxID=1816686 RepID=UPI0009FA80C7|nr:flagellar motor protein MotB [Halomonas massiliensis]MYL22492.1 OmpA family protein [Halomonas alkaliantarctica]